MAAVDSLRSLSDVLTDADRALAAGSSAAARVWPTGFTPLDSYLGGGVRSGELTLLGGRQGLGKTTMALQMLRNVVAGGDTAVYLSFEHDAPLVLERLVAVEAAEHDPVDGPTLRQVREAMEAADGRLGSLAERLEHRPGGAEAVRSVLGFGDRFLVHRSSGSLTDLAAIADVVRAARERTGQPPLVVVDYLQKVAVPGGPDLEDERVTLVVEGLKDLALDAQVPVLAVVAADREGIASGKRLRTQHLRGSTALAYEADIVLVLNDKFDVVARHHLVYDVAGADRFRGFAVLSIEKNRGGLDGVDLEFRKQFEHARFDPAGAVVEEQLVDERVFTE